MSALLSSFLLAAPVADFLQAPFSVSQDSQFLRTSVPPARPVVDLATMTGQGGWTREVHPVWENGAGCYTGANGNGYIFKVLGTNFRLEGLMNANGGGLSVTIDGVAAGTGSCYAATTTRGTYYQATGLTNTVHTVIVLKTSGLVLILNTVSAA